ncbi:MAG: helix-turn-helix transcriptional regulator [Bacteroidaceae bacterium]|nr:helix-turn-helix transcriptional regulator [Bacteroidaceae bacterium]
MEEIKDRVKQVMDRENLTAGAFADSIGVSPATITHILNGRNKYPSTEVLLRLHNRYPDVSMQWLLLGEGEGIEMSSITPESLFDESESGVNATTDAGIPENRKEMGLKDIRKDVKEAVVQEVIYKERPVRKITEIRIFFDDNTYETFTPTKNP